MSYIPGETRLEYIYFHDIIYAKPTKPYLLKMWEKTGVVMLKV